jgi:hypothetical protein
MNIIDLLLLEVALLECRQHCLLHEHSVNLLLLAGLLLAASSSAQMLFAIGRVFLS